MMPGRPTDLPADLPALAALAARVGADPALVQGAGGNVSVKHDGVMWIKASGTWLAHALARSIMVPVALGPLREALAADDPSAEACLPFVRADLNPHGLRPSIETSVHALMPPRVVVHVHCVETIATAVREDAEAEAGRRLDDLPWRFVPYAKPGLSLARAMRRVGAPDAAVLVLGNHGLVVAADDVAGVERLLADVVPRLRRPARPATPPQSSHLARLAHDTGYVAPEDDALHAVATDPASLAVALGGSLYPDHVIFLGPGAVALQDGETIAEACQRARRPAVPLILVPGAGVLVAREATAGTLALARCLGDVASRLGDAPLRYLTPSDEAALLDWDAEKYRQALDKAAR